MKARLGAALAALLWCASATAATNWWEDFKEHVSNNVEQSKRAWHEGRYDLYLSGYTWHLPFAYSSEDRDEYNNNAWGGGIGKSVIDDKGRTHGLFAFAFDDSHGKPQYNFGYSWTTYWGIPRTRLDAGLGYTAFFFMRSDYANYFPIPVVLPLASLRWNKSIELLTTYVPGGEGNGNVMLFFGRASWK
jgi:palmitoyl transferase